MCRKENKLRKNRNHVDVDDFKEILTDYKGVNDAENQLLINNVFEYISDELPHIMAMADIIVSRAGSNSISEFLALKKPNLLIPLSAKASRGDQILNAKSFEKQGFSMVLDEDNMTYVSLEKSIRDLYEKREEYIKNMENSSLSNGVKEVMKVINKYVK